MGFFRGAGRMLKPLVNIPKWMDANRIASDAGYIGNLVKRILTPEKAKLSETFEEALERLHITEQDIKTRYKEFRRLSTIFFILFLAVVGYIIFLTTDAAGEVSWRALLLSTVVSLIALSQFIRFHFWVYQIKQRRLGSSFKEYIFRGLLGIKL